VTGGSPALTRGLCDNRGVAHDAALVAASLGEAKALVLAEIERVVADRRRHGYAPLYDQLAVYPFREGKGLRPALVLAQRRS
jgi:geranylgeranyl diphosphate synthase type II